MAKAFDFTTSQILDWKIEKIHDALIHEEIDISDHARQVHVYGQEATMPEKPLEMIKSVQLTFSPPFLWAHP